MAKKTYRPKKGHDGAMLTLSLPDRREALVVKDWPYETEDRSEQAALEGHPWITDRPEPSASSAKDSKKGEK